MKKISVFLITVALVAGTVGCAGESCTLTIASTAGGTVTTPGVGTFTRDVGTVVNLVVEAEEGYWFIEWTGDTDTIANVNAASTTITMTSDYSITANFQEDEVVQFADPNLEAVIREAIGKPEGDIYASELAKLTYLSAVDRGIKNLSGIEHCTSLNEAILGPGVFATSLLLDPVSLTDQLIDEPNQISDLSPLAYCNNITYLNLYGNNITDISALAALTNLEGLIINDNLISDISPLAGLTNLRELYLSCNQIGDVSPLANLTNLTWLDLFGNWEISDISPLAGLTKLVWLSVDDSQITDISALSNLTELYRLTLGNNQISDISPLAGLTNLTQLGLYENQISNISPLAGLTSLKYLSIFTNQISDISALANLTELTDFSLELNQISDISPLVENPGLGPGDRVYLTGNPLSPDSINVYIPQLQARGVTVYY